MIAILFPSARVAARRLDVPVRRRTNPDVRVGRWNRQPLDSKQSRLVADFPSFGIEVIEIVAFCFAGVARLLVADVAKSSLLGDLNRIGSDLDFVDLLLFGARSLRRHASNTRGTSAQVVATALQ